jgi:hypothetical protein
MENKRSTIFPNIKNNFLSQSHDFKILLDWKINENHCFKIHFLSKKIKKEKRFGIAFPSRKIMKGFLNYDIFALIRKISTS